MQASGRSNLKKVTLELGGKSPNIVFSDVDSMYYDHYDCLRVLYLVKRLDEMYLSDRSARKDILLYIYIYLYMSL